MVPITNATASRSRRGSGSSSSSSRPTGTTTSSPIRTVRHRPSRPSRCTSASAAASTPASARSWPGSKCGWRCPGSSSGRDTASSATSPGGRRSVRAVSGLRSATPRFNQSNEGTGPCGTTRTGARRGGGARKPARSAVRADRGRHRRVDAKGYDAARRRTSWTGWTSKGSLVYYIESKEDLLYDVIKAVHEEGLANIKSLAAGEGRTRWSGCATSSSAHRARAPEPDRRPRCSCTSFRTFPERQAEIIGDGHADRRVFPDLLGGGPAGRAIRAEVNPRLAALSILARRTGRVRFDGWGFLPHQIGEQSPTRPAGSLPGRRRPACRPAIVRAGHRLDHVCGWVNDNVLFRVLRPGFPRGARRASPVSEEQEMFVERPRLRQS